MFRQFCDRITRLLSEIHAIRKQEMLADNVMPPGSYQLIVCDTVRPIGHFKTKKKDNVYNY